MDDKYRLSFTIGPVQSFVAQARRTRDLWAGSWLLSYLSERALVAAEKLGGQAVIPHRAGSEKKIKSIDSAIGGIPNRFEIAFNIEETAIEAGNACAQKLNEVWQGIAEFIWKKYVESNAGNGNGVRDIWDRQVNHFWEVSWIVTASPAPKDLAGLELSRRKQFRDSPATIEPGTKCSMMTELQEFSGWHGRGNWEKQRLFWTELRKSANLAELDLRPDEMLSSIGFIKRMFPEVVEPYLRSVELEPSDDLKKQSRWPSLAFFAAAPWLKSLNPACSGLGEDIVSTGLKPVPSKKKLFWDSEFIPAQDFKVEWAKIDASVWHPTGITANQASVDLKELKRTRVDVKPIEDRLSELNRKQRALYQHAQSKPVPYYALLLADGDSMGKLLACLGNPNELSQRLHVFSQRAHEVISPKRNNGRIVYSGGDDVFALLTAESALEAADELRKTYGEAFQSASAGTEIHATLSVAVVYAHFRYPLSSVILTARKLLDDVAKEATGRDSLALGVIQGSGLSAVWSAPWEVVRDRVQFKEMIDRFSIEREESSSLDQDMARSDEEVAMPKFNSSYLYLLRRQFARLTRRSLEKAGSFQSTDWDEQVQMQTNVLAQLANAEFRRRMTRRQLNSISPDSTLTEVGRLMALSHPWSRKQNGDNGYLIDDTLKDEFGFDGWKVSRFLKQIQDGRMVDHE